MYNIINEAHVYDLPKRPSQTTTSAGKSFHGTVQRTRDPCSILPITFFSFHVPVLISATSPLGPGAEVPAETKT